jgi:hypothetical protein
MFLTRLTFSKTCGGVNVLGSICFEESGFELLTSAMTERERAATQDRDCINRIVDG